MADARPDAAGRPGIADRVFDLLVRRRRLALLLILLVTGGFAAGLPRLEFDNSYEMWFLDDDPALVAYRDFLDRFGSDEALVLLVDSEGDPFSKQTLDIVDAISSRVLAHPEVRAVWSLTHAEAPVVDASGAPTVRTLLGPEAGPQDVEHARALVSSSPLYGLLVPAPEGPTAILLRLERTGRSFEPKAQLVRETRRLAKEECGGRRFWLAGAAAIDEAMYRYSEKDTTVFAPIMVVVLLGVLGLLFRSALGVVLPLVVVGLSLVWGLGFMGWMGWRTNVVTTVLPPLLMAVGIADSVHLLQEFRIQLAHGPVRVALRRAFGAVLRPCLLTTLTTAAGMASLVVASLAGIRELGVTAAVAVVGAFVATMGLTTIVLCSVPERWLRRLGRQRPVTRPRALAPLAALGVRHARWVLGVTALGVIAAGAGIAQLEVGSSMVSYFDEEDPVYQEMLHVDRTFGGTFPFEVLVEAEGEGTLVEPDALRRVQQIVEYLDKLPVTGAAYSYVDFVVGARRALGGDASASPSLPGSREEAEFVLERLGDDEELSRFLSPDRRSARIEVGVEGGRYQELVDDLPALESHISSVASPIAKASVTGLGRLMAEMERYLLSSQLRSFGLAFLLVVALIAVFFRSLRVGLLSAVPNLLPIFFVIGLMGWLGIALDVTTVMLSPLLMGLVVDDTVHVLERAVVARGQDATVRDAFRLAVKHVGSAIVITSLILAAGFATMVFGVFRPNVNFGVLAVVAIALALLCDLVVLPAVASFAPRLLPRPRA